VMLTLVRHQLGLQRAVTGIRKLAELKAEVRILLSVMAHASIRADAKGARAEALHVAMAAGAAEMGIAEEATHTALTLDAAEAALGQLKQLAPLEKARLVKGLFAALTADGTIRVIEAELMRLVGAVLDCPLPPLIDEIDPAALAP
jgi:hypothetical protein